MTYNYNVFIINLNTDNNYLLAQKVIIQLSKNSQSFFIVFPKYLADIFVVLLQYQ